jgi:hypothetical protein
MRETAVEKRLIKQARAVGGDAMKIMPVVRGYPDRLVILPYGRFFFVETKAPDGKLRPDQIAFKNRVARMGIEVHVLYTTKEVDAWVRAHAEEGQ